MSAMAIVVVSLAVVLLIVGAVVLRRVTGSPKQRYRRELRGILSTRCTWPSRRWNSAPDRVSGSHRMSSMTGSTMRSCPARAGSPITCSGGDDSGSADRRAQQVDTRPSQFIERHPPPGDATSRSASAVPRTSGPSPTDSSASVAVSRMRATSSFAPPKDAVVRARWRKRPGDGLLRVGAGEAQGPADVLTVDDFLDESGVERSGRGRRPRRHLPQSLQGLLRRCAAGAFDAAGVLPVEVETHPNHVGRETEPGRPIGVDHVRNHIVHGPPVAQ